MKQPTIWKFPITDAEKQPLMLGISAKPLAVKLQGHDLMLWVLHDIAEPVTKRHIHCFTTGQPIPPGGGFDYIDTVIVRDNYVIHYFIEERQP